MILYQLQCAKGHTFDAWFRDSATYDRQSADGNVECPICGGQDVTKAMMAPHVAKGVTRTGATRTAEPASPAPDSPENQAGDVSRQIRHAIDKIREHVVANFENVGERFADEARAIHYGDSEERDIYGEATEKEADELAEDGVSFYRLPGQTRRTN